MMNFPILLILMLRAVSTVDQSRGTNTGNNDTQTEHQEKTKTDHTTPRLSFDSTYYGFEALAVWMKESPEIPFHVRLPYNAVESKSESGELEYPNKEIQYLCPREKSKDIDILNEMEIKSVEYSGLEYCLLDHSWSRYQSKCMYEVRPYFGKVSRPTEPEVSCGKLYENRTLYAFGFMNDGMKPLLKASLLGIYEICLDTYYSKTMWTKHTVQTGLMLKSPGLPSQHTKYPLRFRNYTFDLPEDIFKDLEAEYEAQEKTNPLHTMIPQMLVPQDDLALKLWKTAAQYYLNTAPLWDKLIPLMNAINDGIRKVGVTIDLKNYENKEEKEGNIIKERTEEKNEEKVALLQDDNTAEKEEKYDDEEERDTHTLNIYTSVTIPYLHWLTRLYNAVVLDILNQKNEPFGWNIWCKFIYYSYKNEGLMIYLHNLPDNPPEVSSPTQDNLKPEKLLKGKECADPVPCDFKSWSNEPDEISDDFLKYAYCCPVDEKKINELFNITIDKKVNLLNIDDIVKENKY